VIKRLGRLYSVLAIFTILSITFFAIGGCNDNNGDGNVGGDVMAGCENIHGTASGEILTGNNCGSPILLGCFVGKVFGDLNGDMDVTIPETLAPTTKEGISILAADFSIITPNPGSSLLIGEGTRTVDEEGNAADLIIWRPDISDGDFTGATGHIVIDTKYDLNNMTYTSTWSGELCLP
jgi:hypothetical protein